MQWVMNHQSAADVLTAYLRHCLRNRTLLLPLKPMPRRMGQILRVDVPRGQSAATAMPVADQ